LLTTAKIFNSENFPIYGIFDIMAVWVHVLHGSPWFDTRPFFFGCECGLRTRLNIVL